VTLARDGSELSLNAGLEMLQIFKTETGLGPDFPMSEIQRINGWSISVAPFATSTFTISSLYNLTLATKGHSMAFSPDQRLFAAAGTRIELFDLEAGIKLTTLEDEPLLKYKDLAIHAMSFSPDGRLLATGGQEAKIRVCSH